MGRTNLLCHYFTPKGIIQDYKQSSVLESLLTSPEITQALFTDHEDNRERQKKKVNQV